MSYTAAESVVVHETCSGMAEDICWCHSVHIPSPYAACLVACTGPLLKQCLNSQWYSKHARRHMTCADPLLQQFTCVALYMTLCPDLVMRLNATHCVQSLTTADTDYRRH